jgi:hypothetical protein
MSKEAVEAIIGKAMLEAEFRAELFADAEAALKGWDLTEEERNILLTLDAETADALAGALDERISKKLFT